MLLCHVYISHSIQQYTCKCISLTHHFSLPSLLITKWTIKYEYCSVNMKLKRWSYCIYKMCFVIRLKPRICWLQHANKPTFNSENEISFSSVECIRLRTTSILINWIYLNRFTLWVRHLSNLSQRGNDGSIAFMLKTMLFAMLVQCSGKQKC